MKLLNKNFKNKPKSFYIICGFIFLLVMYTLFLFFYLKIVGVYGVAIIKEGVATSVGIDIKYEFMYEGEKYTGVFTDSRRYKIGDKYFVLFSRNNPNKNLLQYNYPVPYCLKDSSNSFWSTYPKCPSDSTVSIAMRKKSLNEKYSQYVKKLEGGNTDINYKEFRESFIESTQFVAASKRQREIDSLGNEMFINIKESNYQQVITATKEILSIDYSNMMAHKMLSKAYEDLGDTINAEKHKEILNGLLNSIIKNGDGKTCKTAWPVIQVTEEGFILQMLGAKIQNIEVGNKNGLCDKFEVEINKISITYYFETSNILKGYKILD